MYDLLTWNPFTNPVLPVGDWVADFVHWLVTNYRFVFQAMKQPIDTVLSGVEAGLRACPPLIFITLAFLFAWQVARLRVAIFVAVAFVIIGLIGAWPQAMTTLAIIITSVLVCSVIGIPVGILIAQSDLLESIVRPLLDFLQTIPSFVYLVPIVMLFGIGNVAGVVVTIIYAVSPLIRLTNLGIRQVRKDLVEASNAFGASRWQSLVKIQLPLARPTIMTGINQTIMLSLSMSVIASMISVTGLGQMVLRGIGRLDVALAATGGLGIVLIAMIVDRISQGIGKSDRASAHERWTATGPAGLVRRAWTAVASRPKAVEALRADPPAA